MSGISAESGIVINSRAAHEIVIVVAAMPYLLAVSGLFKGPHIFEPEYPVDRYKNVPISEPASYAPCPPGLAASKGAGSRLRFLQFALDSLSKSAIIGQHLRVQTT